MKLKNRLLIAPAAGIVAALSVAAPASADVTPAAQLTDAELQALHQVSSWTVDYQLTIDISGSAGGAGGQLRGGYDLLGWSASSVYKSSEHDSYSTRGSCNGTTLFRTSGGCSIDYTLPNQFVLSVEQRTETDYWWGPSGIGSACSHDGSASETFTKSGSGTLILDGTPDNRASGPALGIDYSTNPPRADSNNLGVVAAIPTTSSDQSSFCGSSTSSSTTGVLHPSPLIYYDASEGADSEGQGGDTQVRIEDGRFVIRGSSAITYTSSFCAGANFACPGTGSVPDTYTISSSWVITSSPIQAADTTPPVISIPSSPLTSEATGPSGAMVSYSASANDDTNGPVPVRCTPNSGSMFALGSTEVDCTASDAAGNVAHATFNVVVQDTTPPEVQVPDDMSVDATSPSGAVVTYTALAFDLVDGLVPVVCVPPSGTTFPIGTTAVGCSAFDRHGNEGQATFSVRVKGAADQLADLQNYITQNNVGPGTSLLSKLQTALGAVNRQDKPTACGALKALINEANAQSGKKLTTSQASYLVAAANRIRAVLGC